MVDGGMFQRWFTVRYRRLMCFIFLGWDDFIGKHTHTLFFYQLEINPKS